MRRSGDTKTSYIRTGFVILWLSLTLYSCAMDQHYKQLNQLMAADQCPQAIRMMSDSRAAYGGNDQLIYLMDTAMINMLCGNYDTANTYFHDAEALGEDLWTKSISQYTLSMVSNDWAIAYAGEDFERALINLFSAICYLKLGQYDEALVECRRLDSLLNSYNDEYEQDNVYKEDAFGRYLSGLIRETDNELDGAYIDYYAAVKAYQSYGKDYGTPMPSYLLADFLRVAGAVDRMQEARKMTSQLRVPAYKSQKEISRLGKIIFIQLSGKSPIKKENRITVPTPSGPITIAFPKYKVSPPSCRRSTFIMQGGDRHFESPSELVEDINRIAVKCLDDRKGREIVKAVARAVAKQAAIKTASRAMAEKTTKKEDIERRKKAQQQNEIALNLVNTLFLEKADTRTWRTLPGEIYLSRLFVTPGTYRTSVVGCGGGKRELKEIEVRAGETRVILFDSMFP